jgi:poly(3-hydroxybutyrate) depolymerase
MDGEMNTEAAKPPVHKTETHRKTNASRAIGPQKEKGTPTVRSPRNIVACPPGIVDASIETMFEIYGTIVRSTTDYWSSVLDRQASPLDVAKDVMDWSSALRERKPPTWATPNKIVGEWPVARLRDFSAADAPDDIVPTLILPPQAGHDSCIVDYAPGQSQVSTALVAGCAKVFSLDWKGATEETKHATVEDYLYTIRAAIEQIGGHANVVGDCQGGWLATIYSAVHPETVHTLSIAGAPIDFHAGEPLIHDYVQVMAPLGQIDVYEAVVKASDGMLPGEFLLNGFKIMQPEAEIDRQLSLLAHVHDKKHVERYQKFEDWFQHTQPIPGAFYLWIVEHLFQRNELLHDKLEVEGKHVDLHEIHCPLYLLAGAKDHITPPPQVFALAEFAATPDEDVTKLTTNGGHLGIFMGHQSLRDCWKPVFTDIAARSVHQLHPEHH